MSVGSCFDCTVIRVPKHLIEPCKRLFSMSDELQREMHDAIGQGFVLGLLPTLGALLILSPWQSALSWSGALWLSISILSICIFLNVMRRRHRCNIMLKKIPARDCRVTK